MKINIFNIAASVLLVLLLFIIYFMWGCKWDLFLTIFAGVLIVILALVSCVQDKKIKELKEKIGSK